MRTLLFLAAYFFALVLVAQSPVAGGEWFWDEDPGYGAGNYVPLTGDTAGTALPIDVRDLTPGFHKFNIRARNRDGAWGHTFWRGTLLRAEPDAKIERLVYTYWEDRPVATFRYELAEPVHYLDVSFAPETEGLSVGTDYRFCIGVERTDGMDSYMICRDLNLQDIANSLSEPGVLPLSIYPNPNRGTFTVELPQLASTGGVFELFDPVGRSVHRRMVEAGSAETVEVSLPSTPPGVYFAVVERAGQVRVTKVTIQP